MFRRLYWIVEQENSNGTSQVTGIYTSIQDLIHTGFQWKEGVEHRLRLSLWKPDTFGVPLGTWDASGFSHLQTDLQAFVETNEYTPAEVSDLIQELEKFRSVNAA